MPHHYKSIKLILGDQLNENHSWYDHVDNNALFVLMEVRSETDYVKHHIQKIVAIFDAMRKFAEVLIAKGHQVKYFKINDAHKKIKGYLYGYLIYNLIYLLIFDSILVE
jgi:deoxyribodipyrimidine photolyase-related protein